MYYQVGTFSTKNTKSCQLTKSTMWFHSIKTYTYFIYAVMGLNHSENIYYEQNTVYAAKNKPDTRDCLLNGCK